MVLKGRLKVIVLYLIDGKEMSGYGLMKKIEEMLGTKPSPGSIYPLLETLVDKGELKFKHSGKKKLYRLTAKGKRQLNQEKQCKKEILESIEKVLKTYFSIEEADDMIFFQTMIEEIKKGDVPFAHLHIEMHRFWKALMPFIKDNKHKNTTVVKKKIREVTSDIRHLA